MELGVKFGVRVHQSGYSFEDLKAIFTLADRLGYYSATLYDLLNIPALECWTTLSALAAVTDRIRLVPMVLANLYRPPALLAKMSATLDVISGGRLELGIGAGGSRGDHLASGIPFPSTFRRVDMLVEAVELIKRLWVEDKVDFSGLYYHLSQASVQPKPVQKPHPPVIIGGHGEIFLLGAVASHADICNIGIGTTLEEYWQKLEVLVQHCLEVGRDFSEIEISHNAHVLIAKTSSDLDQRITRQAQAVNLTPQEFQEELSRYICGTPEQCVRQIQHYVDHSINYFFLIFPDPVSSQDLRLFAEEVMPQFQ